MTSNGEKSKYPEHEKLAKVKNESQVIGGFLEWLDNEEGVSLCRFEGVEIVIEHTSVEALLAKYFEIDLKVIEREKRAMLDELRQAAKLGHFTTTGEEVKR